MSDITANPTHTPFPPATTQGAPPPVAPTLRQLAAALRPHRKRELAGLAAIAVVAAFGFGWALQAWAVQPELDRLAADRAALQARVADLQAERATVANKAAFLGDYLGYRIAKDAYIALASPANRAGMDRARARLAQHVSRLPTEAAAHALGADAGSARLTLSAGGAPGFGGAVRFERDGSVWPLPQELGF